MPRTDTPRTDTPGAGGSRAGAAEGNGAAGDGRGPAAWRDGWNGNSGDRPYEITPSDHRRASGRRLSSGKRAGRQAANRSSVTRHGIGVPAARRHPGNLGSQHPDARHPGERHPANRHPYDRDTRFAGSSRTRRRRIRSFARALPGRLVTAAGFGSAICAVSGWLSMILGRTATGLLGPSLDSGVPAVIVHLLAAAFGTMLIIAGRSATRSRGHTRTAHLIIAVFIAAAGLLTIMYALGRTPASSVLPIFSVPPGS